MTESEDVARQFNDPYYLRQLAAFDHAVQDAYDEGDRNGYLRGFSVAALTSICIILGFVVWMRWADLTNWIRGMV